MADLWLSLEYKNIKNLKSRGKTLSIIGKVGCPFFGEFILDCLNGTENAMPQEHTFRAAELCIEAQEKAIWIETANQQEVSAK
jgi:hypothetical protein